MTIQGFFILFRRAFNKLIVNVYHRCILGRLGKKTVIPLSVRFDNPGRIYIGNNVSIGRLSWLAAVPLTGDETCKLTIGDGTYIGNGAHFYSTSGIEIAKNVLIADHVYLADNRHGFKDVTCPVVKQPVEQLKKVVIGEGAWLGEHVCVIGATVGKHAVVGANAVVTKDIPDYCVAVGSPANVIKRYDFERNAWVDTRGLTS